VETPNMTFESWCEEWNWL